MKHQPVKQGQTTTPGILSPTLSDKCVGSLTSHANRCSRRGLRFVTRVKKIVKRLVNGCHGSYLNKNRFLTFLPGLTWVLGFLVECVIHHRLCARCCSPWRNEVGISQQVRSPLSHSCEARKVRWCWCSNLSFLPS